jgi:hypothetical protein
LHGAHAEWRRGNPGQEDNYRYIWQKTTKNAAIRRDALKKTDVPEIIIAPSQQGTHHIRLKSDG